MRMNMKRTVGVVGAVVVIGMIVVFAYRAQVNHPQSATDERHSPPILIPGVQEPDEMRVEPIPVAVLTPPERLLGEAMQQAGNKGSPAVLMPALDRILAQYPDFSDGYVMRLGSLCDGGDRTAILSNVNNALKYVSNFIVK